MDKKKKKLVKLCAKGKITNEELAEKINCSMEEARLLTNAEITKLIIKVLKKGQ